MKTIQYEHSYKLLLGFLFNTQFPINKMIQIWYEKKTNDINKTICSNLDIQKKQI